MPHTLYFKPIDGEIVFDNEIVSRETIAGLPEKRHRMKISEVKPKRTPGANAYYWAVVIDYFMKEMGIPKSKTGQNYMHYDVLGQELRQIPDPHRPGKTMTAPTRTMDGSTFWKYIYQCEILFNHMYNGSFPPPLKLGYDTTKR